jgi:protein DGCR14
VVSAATKADLAALKTLHASGADLNAGHRGYRALHALIQSKPHAAGHTPTAHEITTFNWLLDHGADPSLDGGWPAVNAALLAAFTGLPEFIEILLTRGVTKDVNLAAALGDAALVHLQMASSPDNQITRFSFTALTPLHCAAASRLGARDPKVAAGLLDVARMALDAGADVNATVRSRGHDLDAAYFAANAGHLEMFELLLARGANPTAALAPAMWNTKDRFAEFGAAAIAHGAEIDRAEAAHRPLLNDLIRWGQFAPARWLLEHGADPNRAQGRDGSDTAGWTALHQAASRGNARMAEAVIAAGGRPDARDAAGRTPLDVARAAPIRRWLRASAPRSTMTEA